jgi:hypothetical protein
MDLKGRYQRIKLVRLGLQLRWLRWDETSWVVFGCRMVMYWSRESTSLDSKARRQSGSIDLVRSPVLNSESPERSRWAHWRLSANGESEITTAAYTRLSASYRRLPRDRRRRVPPLDRQPRCVAPSASTPDERRPGPIARSRVRHKLAS